MFFAEMVRIACNTSNPPRCAVAGGLRSYQFHKLLQMYYLYTNQKDLMTMYKTFASFAAFKAWADNTNDRELVIKVQIVEEYKEEIPTILDKINERCRYDPENSDYIFTSTHKAKGLEWKTVIILDDFFRKDGNEIGAVPGGIFTRPWKNGLEEFGNDEKNILYVAMTRAKKNLVFNFALLNLLLGNGDTFERVVYMKDRKVYSINLHTRTYRL
jgi:F-box protein 18 (helicase)